MNQTVEYRAYFFVNMYLSSLQCGLQAGHAIAEMFTLYHNVKKLNEDWAITAANTLYNWAEYHKTIIILNGGNHEDLGQLYSNIGYIAASLKLPYINFHEDENSLNGAATCVGIILPNSIYELKKQKVSAATNDEIWCNADGTISGNILGCQLVEIISKYHLAR